MQFMLWVREGDEVPGLRNESLIGDNKVLLEVCLGGG